MNTPTNQEMIQAITLWLGSGSINIFGRQFSGKDTQGELLAEIFNAPLIGGGDILRNSVVPAHVQAELDKGELITTEDYVKIVLPYLGKSEFEGRPLILSSVGRWYGEEKSVIEATSAAKHPLKSVILLKISESTAYERLALADRGRDDDHEENLLKRLEEFENKTIPVITEYRKLGLLTEVNGEQTPEKVQEDVINALFDLATK